MFSNQEVLLLNYCRLYLQVVTISDISKVFGTRLHTNFLQDTTINWSPKSKNIKIRQRKPGPKAWRVWRQANSLWTTKNGKLYQHLGQWLYTPSQQRMHTFVYPNHKKIVFLFTIISNKVVNYNFYKLSLAG